MTRSILIFLFITAFITVASSNEYHKVVIIGAGPSGLATGVKLLENGIDDLIILEAEPRIGGRIKTVDFDGINVDLGAEFCEGQKGNIIYEYLEKNKLLYLLERITPPETFFISSGKNISDEFGKELFDIVVDVYMEGDFENSTESYGAEVPRRFNEAISKKYKNDPEKLKVAKSCLHFIRQLAMGLDSGLTWNDIAADDAEFQEAEGDHLQRWKDHGYKIFLDILIKKYPNPEKELPIKNKILLNKTVTKIIINSSDNRVKILCSDSSTYEATHLIFTPSLGVLKEHANHLFEPKLPPKKLTAIQNIGFGVIGKILVQYDTKWWGDLQGFNFLWTEEDLEASKEKFTEGPVSITGESWIADMYSVQAKPNSNVLLIWLSGDTVPVIETVDEQILKNGIYYMLNWFLGNKYDIPKNPKVMRSVWYNNPNFRGSYSYTSMKTKPEDGHNLLEPISTDDGKPIIQFAGEATNRLHHSTVHGAVESGFREAERLIKFLKSN